MFNFNHLAFFFSSYNLTFIFINQKTKAIILILIFVFYFIIKINENMIKTIVELHNKK